MDFTGVHILFCDHDPSSGSETLSLLQKCSYKVTTVKSARQVVDVLKSEESHVDIVLTDVELPQEKSFKMLNHIFRQENLGHIAVVVMSQHDEMAVVAKCLRLGAVDYLVKPLRLNEVMNLWTHMWRKRRSMGLPDKHVGITDKNASISLQRPGKTVDLLSGYQNAEPPTFPTDVQHTVHREDASPQLELSLRLSLNYSADKLSEHAHGGSLPLHSSPSGERIAHPSAFSAYLRTCSLQPDEQSGTNACSPSSSPSKRTRYSRECITHGNQESLGGVLADASFSSFKDASEADKTRPGDGESQLCGQVPMEQVPTQCITSDERIFHAGQASAAHAQGFQPCYAFMGSPSISMHQSVTSDTREAKSQGYNIALNPSLVQQPPPYGHESGMANVQPIPNVFSYYPVAHLAVPVVNFSTWPALISPPPPMVGGKLIQAERREAALSKFRLKRKGRCFEKKIRYASRKKLAEQRPRVRGQFVKRSAFLADNTGGIHDASDEEGEADDEQGCSELDNHSSPDCIAENGRVC
ncbi:hypothetical protein GOP47_0000300 [Adiantum capillus-veneris]|uniref:Two-component response regulator-like APRR1 n=1 Tax=Adiantum capillus-veneris TaxID=13818 RepID=A0A9D4ZS84_ADICA|nr:hypothetical protein GOP47_0000300 [Adiantum capillus-veneris]